MKIIPQEKKQELIVFADKYLHHYGYMGLARKFNVSNVTVKKILDEATK